MLRIYTCSIIVALFLAASVATAGTISETETFAGIPNLNEALEFNQFDTLGGIRTLTSVEVIVALEVTGGQLILDNDSDDPASGTFEFGAKGNISSTDVTLLNIISQPVTAEVKAVHSDPFNLLANVGDGSQDYDPSGPDGLQYDGGTENDGDSGFIDPTYHGEYTGAGTYEIDVALTQWIDYGGLGGIEVSYNPVSATGTVTVIYNYVPEPATICLLALGGLAVIRRKRR